VQVVKTKWAKGKSPNPMGQSGNLQLSHLLNRVKRSLHTKVPMLSTESVDHLQLVQVEKYETPQFILIEKNRSPHKMSGF